MAITDELREYANIATDRDIYAGARLCKIADRIDAAHERELRESYDSGYASADDWLAQHEDAMADHGWVRLPVDADGMPIRIGDVMEMDGEPFEVRRIELDESGEWTMRDRMGVGHLYAHLYRHHHTPTVEDVLREFALACEDAGNAGPEVERIAAEFAKRLTLAEEVDE